MNIHVKTTILCEDFFRTEFEPPPKLALKANHRFPIDFSMIIFLLHLAFASDNISITVNITAIIIATKNNVSQIWVENVLKKRLQDIFSSSIVLMNTSALGEIIGGNMSIARDQGTV